jgi:hypothetical protein
MFEVIFDRNTYPRLMFEIVLFVVQTTSHIAEKWMEALKNTALGSPIY